jgi:hypothetical protein
VPIKISYAWDGTGTARRVYLANVLDHYEIDLNPAATSE